VLERIPLAFLAGLVSVITPCVLPLVPVYLSAVSAIEAERLGKPGAARRRSAGAPSRLGSRELTGRPKTRNGDFRRFGARFPTPEQVL